MKDFDYRESTITYDYNTRTPEFYFTRRSNFDKCRNRNPNYIVAEHLEPGYRIVYPFNQMRTPEFLLRVPKALNYAQSGDIETLWAA